MSLLPKKKPKKTVQESIDRFIVDDFYTIRSEQTIGSAIDSLRTSNKKTSLFYIYVVDADDRFVGVVPVRKLLIMPPETIIAGIMFTKIIKIPAGSPIELAMEFFIIYKLLALPVVDTGGKLLGVVNASDFSNMVMDEFEQDKAEQIFSVIGLRVAELRSKSLWEGVRIRFPWLLFNIAGGLGSAYLAGLFKATIEQFVVISFFIPITLILSESIGMQTMSSIIDRLDGRLIKSKRALIRETIPSAILGALSGTLIVIVAYLWFGNLLFCLGLFLAIVLTSAASAITSAYVPLVITYFGHKPGIASGPLVLALTDNISLIIYLCTVGLILGFA